MKYGYFVGSKGGDSLTKVRLNWKDRFCPYIN